MKLIALIFFVGFQFLVSFGQELELVNRDSVFIYSDAPSNSKLLFIENCENARIIAEQDIKNQDVLLLIVGGIAPAIYVDDINFQKKYQLTYSDYGDLPAEHDCMMYYNFRIFNFLTEKYGRKWKREIRKDVYGFKEWKREKRRLSYKKCNCP